MCALIINKGKKKKNNPSTSSLEVRKVLMGKDMGTWKIYPRQWQPEGKQDT